MKIFEVIIDTENDPFKIYVDAENQKAAEEKCVKDGKIVCIARNQIVGEEECVGVGEIVRIKDVTAIYQPKVDNLRASFKAIGMGKLPMDHIIAMLKSR